MNMKIDEGILFVESKYTVPINLQIAENVVRERLAFQNGIDYPILFKIKVQSADKKVRDYMSKEGARGIKAAAFIERDAVTKVVLNFFFTVWKSKSPVKFFIEEKDALVWLKEFV